jgi:prepilin peptidase CpaA
MDETWGSLPASFAGQAALAVYIFALVLAAVSDFVSLRIPNWLTASLALAFPVAALIAGQGVDWLSHVEAGVAVFVGAAILFAFRVMGGGDVKLLAATALWGGLNLVLPFLALVAVVGGIFAIVVLALRHPVVHATLLQTLRRLPSFVQKKMPIPYGIPIAIAGIMMAPRLLFLS